MADRAEAVAEAEKKGLHKHFKLSSSLSTSNMTLFDERHRIHKWETAEQLMLDFYTLRCDPPPPATDHRCHQPSRAARRGCRQAVVLQQAQAAPL